MHIKSKKLEQGLVVDLFVRLNQFVSEHYYIMFSWF